MNIFLHVCIILQNRKCMYYVENHYFRYRDKDHDQQAEVKDFMWILKKKDAPAIKAANAFKEGILRA